MNYLNAFERLGADAGAERRGPRIDRAGMLPFGERLASLRRAWRKLALWLAVCVGLALAYCLTATPKFVAVTGVVLEPRQPVLSTDPAAQSTAPTLDSALADSQVQVLMSRRNLQYVFDVEHLADDPEFARDEFSLVGWLLGHLPLGADKPVSREEAAQRAREAAFERFAGGVAVKRLAQSYAFELSYAAQTPAKAARLANAVTAAYIRDKLNYNIAATAAQRGGDFLRNRVADVKAEQDAIDEAVKTGVIPDLVFGHADARIISAAVEPLRKSSPKTTLITLLAAAFGLASGVGGVFLADELGRRVRSAPRLQALTGVVVLAALPKLRGGRRNADAWLRAALDAPQSPFAAGLRNVRVAALQCAEAGRTPALGVLAQRRGEGASLVAANLAALIAEGGSPTALVDADAQHPRLTRAWAPQVRSGWADAASPELAPVGPQLSLLPARAPDGEVDANALVGFPAVVAACAALAKTHFVIADLPPAAEFPEGEAIARRLTGVFVVVDAQASADDCVALLERLGENDVRVLGVVLNRAELS